MRIEVYGTPAPQGSKRHVGNGVMVEMSKKVKPWRAQVEAAARKAIPVCGCGCGEQVPTWGGRDPLTVHVAFYLARPRGHYGTGRNAETLKAHAPERPVTTPDIDKLLRSTLDGLTEAGVWSDDARVVYVSGEKWYDDDRMPGATIDIWPEGQVPF